MKYFIIILLILMPAMVWAGGDSEAVKLLSLVEDGKDKYILKYKIVDSQNIITVNLEYKAIRYLLLDFLSKEKYNEAIELLKMQLASGTPTRFGFFGGGPCLVDRMKNIYRSDTLDIYEEYHGGQLIPVVYAFCEYK